MTLRPSPHAIERAWERWELDLAAVASSIEAQITAGTAKMLAVQDDGRVFFAVTAGDREIVVLVAPDGAVVTALGADEYRTTLRALMPKPERKARKLTPCNACNVECHYDRSLITVKPFGATPGATPKKTGPSRSYQLCPQCKAMYDAALVTAFGGALR